MVEDSPADAELVSLELRRECIDAHIERVDSAPAMTAALDRGGWDIVIADYLVPGFGGLEALRMVQERALDLPFIVVSGNIGEETAVAAMKAGAHDYVLKQNLTRLGVAVVRELREADVRRDRRHAVEALGVLARRSSLLAEAGRTLAASLNFDETLAEAARIALPEAADWCLLAVLEEDGLGVRAELAHVDPRRERWAQEYLRSFPLDPLAGGGPARVIRSGRHEWTTASTVLLTVGPPAEAEDLVRTLGYRSGLCVPLQARDRTLGAMTLVRASAARERSGAELAFAEELATRAALALDSAALYRQAREAVRARDEFLSVASHELSTPLTTLALQMDDLIRTVRAGHVGARDVERLGVGVLRARRQVERLSRLLGNLLDVSRIAAHRLELCLAEVDLVATTREVLEQFAPELARAGCSVQLDAPAALTGRWDALRLAQVLTNLLSNACKYGAGQPIEVAVGPEPNMAVLTVRDHGIGIPPCDCERIFRCYERAVSTHHYGGLGLGLYITRQLVEAHGGSVRVTSQPGAGATFEVRLPLGPPTHPEAQDGHAGERFRQADLDC
jgi:signal transduction histidine kinase